MTKLEQIVVTKLLLNHRVYAYHDNAGFEHASNPLQDGTRDLGDDDLALSADERVQAREECGEESARKTEQQGDKECRQVHLDRLDQLQTFSVSNHGNAVFPRTFLFNVRNDTTFLMAMSERYCYCCICADENANCHQ